MTPKPWQEIAADKKAEQASRIPSEWKLSEKVLKNAETTVDLRPIAASCGILTAKELKITDEYDATDLAAEVAKGTYTAVEVTTAYCKRAAIAQQLLSCLTEIRFLEAIEDSRKLDEEFKKTGKPVGRLHGVPMTCKECFHLKGFDSSNAYITRCFDPATFDSYLIQLLNAEGAVFIAKTNIPQSMLAAEAHNNVFGQTKNPVVSHLNCGGSSGGEGSVLAYKGSALGIGTDVAGSIRRCPCAANGVYGFKPSNGIFPMINYAASNWPGMNTGIPAVCGPMGNSARDLTLFYRVIRDAKPWNYDPALVPQKSECDTSDRKPVVGVFTESGKCTPHPPVRRAIKEAVAKLKEAGFEVREFVPPDFTEIRNLSHELLSLDGLSYAKGQMEEAGEPPVVSVLKSGFWDKQRKTFEEAWAFNAKKIEMQKKMLDAWQAAKVDVVLGPAGPHTAVTPNEWVNYMYTVAWNVVDYPACIVPFTTADPEKDPKDTSFNPQSELDAQNEAMYDPVRMAGAPVAIQLVGPRLGDEQLLKDVEMIDTVLKA
ncbi:amidase [Talaromyces proteolyticus]|uniref:Amidase n=1 Tax=Talaromyces proteolyticus TaxID=1131652 RepID=A0AAD4KGX8_9EURO|nr:amidase [Talaromyces proteolyticus]KAH8690127.1 amidase [Talaromyces proteolyticus]